MRFRRIAQSSSKAVFIVLGIQAGFSRAQSLPANGYSITGPLNFIGAPYESSTGTDAAVQFVNNSGEAAGYSNIYATSAYTSSPIGQAVWLFNGTTSVEIGLVGGIYGPTPMTSVTGLNGIGDAIGESQRTSGNAAGPDAWFYNGGTSQQIGLTGGVYEYVSTGFYARRTLEDSQAMFLNNSGEAAGISDRYDSSGNSLGQDTWFFNGTTTSQIGFFGSGYQYTTSTGGVYAESEPRFLNDAGEVVGLSARYDTDGNEISDPEWVFNGTTTQALGLTGPGYQYTYTGPGGGTITQSYAMALNNAGDVMGTSDRFDSTGSNLGTDSWVFNGSTTQQIGLSGGSYQYTNVAGEAVENSTPVSMNNSGQVIGYSKVYNSSGQQMGQDVWLFNGSTNLKLGLSGPQYVNDLSGGITNNASLLNNAGQVAGGTILGNGTAVGTDCWFFNGSTTQQIGLLGGVYQYVNNQGLIFRNSNLIALNGAGDVVGQSARYGSSGGSLGSDAWFFDSSTDTTYTLQFSLGSSGMSLTQPEILTDSGVVLGYYDLYSGSTSLGDRAFWWSDSAGFHDLGTIVNGFSAAGWSDLANTLFSEGDTSGGAPQYIVGTGTFLNNGVPDGGIYELTADVPEPAVAAMLLCAAPGLLLRRRSANRSK
jgi:hypothetical protein